MMKFSRTLLLSAAFVALSSQWAFADALVGDAKKGKTIFDTQCAACHSLTINRIGPVLGGVYGRKSGTAANFTYSTAVKGSNLVWSDATIDQWLTNPQALIAGQKMNFKIPDPQKRADVIAYLKTVPAP